MDTISITELGERTREAQLALGIRQDTTWYNYLNAIEPIVKRHLEHGKDAFDYDIVSTFMREQEKRLSIGEISQSALQKYKCGADRLRPAPERKPRSKVWEHQLQYGHNPHYRNKMQQGTYCCHVAGYAGPGQRI